MNGGPMLSPMAMAPDMEQLNDGTGYVSMGGHIALPVGYVRNEIHVSLLFLSFGAIGICVG
jgi:hypothetical protein